MLIGYTITVNSDETIIQILMQMNSGKMRGIYKKTAGWIQPSGCLSGAFLFADSQLECTATVRVKVELEGDGPVTGLCVPAGGNHGYFTVVSGFIECGIDRSTAGY